MTSRQRRTRRVRRAITALFIVAIIIHIGFIAIGVGIDFWPLASISALAAIAAIAWTVWYFLDLRRVPE